jgi:hypothetical protein
VTEARLLADLDWMLAQCAPSSAGAVWRLQEPERQLDANLVRLPADERIELHREPDVDVLLLPLIGGGTLHTDAGQEPLVPHALMWLPRGSRRALVAGPEGLAYVTVHRRRAGLSIRLAGDPEVPQRLEASGRERAAHRDGSGASGLPRLCPRCGAPGEAAVDRTCSNCGAVLTG